MNNVSLMGRLARDPELRHTQSGLPVVSFTIAIDRRFSKETEQRQADFIDCVAWRGTAEFVSKYFSKGNMIAVQGRLQTRNWDDKETGKKRYATEVQVDQVYFTGSKQESSGGSGGGYAPYNDKDAPPIDAGYSAPAAQSSDFAELDSDDGELPF